MQNSKYRAADGNWYNTRFNGNYNVTALGGKEFRVGKKKRNTIGLNGKFVYSGGNRYTPIDFAASQQAGETAATSAETIAAASTISLSSVDRLARSVKELLEEQRAVRGSTLALGGV